MRYIHVLAFLFYFGFISVKSVSAKIYINEFSSVGTDDWVELFNDSDEEVELNGYLLRDNTETNKKELDGIISAHGFLIVEWNKLNEDSDTVRVVVGEEVIDTITYGTLSLKAPEGDQSAGRVEDSTGEWVLFSAHSRGTTNSESEVYEAPDPTAPNTPTPTRISTPTKTPKPTKTLTPTAIQRPEPSQSEEGTVVSPSPLLTIPKTTGNTESSSESATLGISAILRDPSRRPNSHKLDAGRSKVLGATRTHGGIAVIFGSVLFLTSGGIMLFKKYRYLMNR